MLNRKSWTQAKLAEMEKDRQQAKLAAVVEATGCEHVLIEVKLGVSEIESVDRYSLLNPLRGTHGEEVPIIRTSPIEGDFVFSPWKRSDKVEICKGVTRGREDLKEEKAPLRDIIAQELQLGSNRRSCPAQGAMEFVCHCHSSILSSLVKVSLKLDQTCSIEDFCIAFIAELLGGTGEFICMDPELGFTSTFAVSFSRDTQPLNTRDDMQRPLGAAIPQDKRRNGRVILHAWWAPTSKFWNQVRGNMSTGAALSVSRAIADRFSGRQLSTECLIPRLSSA